MCNSPGKLILGRWYAMAGLCNLSRQSILLNIAWKGSGNRYDTAFSTVERPLKLNYLEKQGALNYGCVGT